jgi:uncharacterized protein
MTPQEQQMLQDLVQKITSTPLQEKDPDAESFLRQGLGHDQDAVYKLAQTVLVQNIALDAARRQLQQLQQGGQQQQPGKATSFLGSLFGHKDAPPQQPQQPGGYQQVPPSYAQNAAPVYGGQPQYAAPPPSGQPSFLRSAATTAAGVAAGALAFQGVESLLHGGGGGYGGGFGGGFGGGDFGGGRPTEEIVNNYYDDNSGGGNYGGPNEQPQGGYDAGSFDGPNEQPQGGGFDDQSFDSGGGGFGDGSDFGGDEGSFS